MARKTYVQCHETGKWVEKHLASQYSGGSANKSASVHASFEAFKSPIDGSIIAGPRGLREHNRKHGVTNVRDYGEGYFDRKAKERSADTIGANARGKAERINTIKQAIHKHRN